MKKFIIVITLFLTVNAFGQAQLQKEASGFVGFVSSRVMQLADAMPQENYNWTPQEGVRSFGSVLAHLASANYFFATKLGAKLPDDVNMEAVGNLQNKEEIKAELKRSYDLVINAINNTKDGTLATKVEYPFPGEFTNMSSILIVMGHSNEHLGQLIAYARMNGIAPPWSQGQDQ